MLVQGRDVVGHYNTVQKHTIPPRVAVRLGLTKVDDCTKNKNGRGSSEQSRTCPPSQSRARRTPWPTAIDGGSSRELAPTKVGSVEILV